MLFILQVLRELTLPYLDTETGVNIRFSGKLSERGPQISAIAKGRCGITWIKELNLFHIAIYDLNSRA